MIADQKDTIAALATPVGTSGVAIVRLSGPASLSILEKLSARPSSFFQSHQVYFLTLKDVKGAWLDDVIAIYMQSPRSFTGEDVVELQCHGSMLIVRKILQACYESGARAAHPGEFSFRAFSSGKIDLAQAEAIQELIHAKSELALESARRHLQGELSVKIRGWQKDLVHQAAILEAWVDFPEEGLEFASFEQVQESIEGVAESIEKVLATYHDGHLIAEGIRVCLLGRPNVGKSSLMNALLKKERSIVTDIEGTTRDVIEEQATLCSLNVRLIDTAGVREGAERVEQEGIRRTWQKVKEADLVLWILDASSGYTELDIQMSHQVPKEKTILVWNKSDLPHENLPDLGLPHVARISALEKQGLEELQAQIRDTVWTKGVSSQEEVLLTSLRHKKALEEALTSLRLVNEGLSEGISAEFVCSDMRRALVALAKVIGTDVTEDIITAIFSTFCLGK